MKPNDAVGMVNKLPEGELREAFALLEPQLLHISQDVIRSMWKTLPNSTEQKVQRLLRSIERPVIARHVGDRVQIEAQAALRSTIRSLGKRLPRMPFPTNTREVHFDYEALLKDNVKRSDTDGGLALPLTLTQRRLEHRLTSTISSIASLKDEIGKHKQWLASENQDLRTRERDCQAEEDRWKRQTEKVGH